MRSCSPCKFAPIDFAGYELDKSVKNLDFQQYFIFFERPRCPTSHKKTLKIKKTIKIHVFIGIFVG